MRKGYLTVPYLAKFVGNKFKGVMMWKPIVCTIVSVACAVFWLVFVLRRIIRLPKILNDVKGMGQDQFNELSWQYDLCFYCSSGCAFVSALAFSYSGFMESANKIGMAIIGGVILALGVTLTFYLFSYYRKLFKKINIQYSSSGNKFVRFSGLEGLFGVVTVGLAIYSLILLFIGLL